MAVHQPRLSCSIPYHRGDKGTTDSGESDVVMVVVVVVRVVDVVSGEYAYGKADMRKMSAILDISSKRSLFVDSSSATIVTRREKPKRQPHLVHAWGVLISSHGATCGRNGVRSRKRGRKKEKKRMDTGARHSDIGG